MSKRNRYKFRNRDAQQVQQTNPAVAQNSPAAVSPAPSGSFSKADGAFAQHAAEYRIINKDLIRLVVLNLIMLAAVFALYYANRSSGLVENLYTKLFR